MNWLKWRDALKPSGQYNRTLFLFWFFVPVVCIVLLLLNTWELEKPLIRFSFFVGLSGLNARAITQIIVVLLVLFLAYLIILALVKRSSDLNRSGWLSLLIPIPIVGMLYLVYLLFWPGKASNSEAKKTGWLRIGAMSLAAIVVFALFALGSVLLGIYGLTSWMYGIGNEPLVLRVWNQTGETLNVTLIVSEGIVFQGYPVDEIKPNQILKKGRVLSRESEYAVIISAKNTAGEAVYSKRTGSIELARMNGIILIPRH